MTTPTLTPSQKTAIDDIRRQVHKSALLDIPWDERFDDDAIDRSEYIVRQDSIEYLDENQTEGTGKIMFKYEVARHEDSFYYTRWFGFIGKRGGLTAYANGKKFTGIDAYYQGVEFH